MASCPATLIATTAATLKITFLFVCGVHTAWCCVRVVNGARGVVVDFKKPVKQDNKEESYDESKEYPEVLFTSGVRRLITPEEWNIGGTSHMHLYNIFIYIWKFLNYFY